MKLRAAAKIASMLMCLTGVSAGGQTAVDRIASGDRELKALNLSNALREFEAALAIQPDNHDALVKAAQAAVELGEFNANADQRAALYASAEQYARRALAANANSAEAHFELAQALGRNALAQSARDRIKFAREVRDQALEALKVDPQHSGALHVMGMWNAEVMRLNGFTRMLAKNFLGGKVFGEANWDDAQKYLERAVTADPDRIIHRLDLAGVYADRHDRARAIEQYEWIARAPSSAFNDPRYKDEAARKLNALR